MDKNDLVFPGSFLAYEEEFMAGSNAFEDEEGKVYSTNVGYKELDSDKHEANVKTKKNVKLLERGDIVFGVVTMMKDKVVLIGLREAETESGKKVLNRTLASLLVFNIQNSYVNRTDEVFRIGDIVRARVLEVTNYGIELETKDSDLGVVKAFGIKTRQPLLLMDGKLRDPTTGETEERKISSEYVLR